jgi:hypothetical protein
MTNDQNYPWYRLIQFEIRIVYQMFPGDLTVQGWAFNIHRINARTHKGLPCFWIAGAIRILGLDVGAGVFWRKQ